MLKVKNNVKYMFIKYFITTKLNYGNVYPAISGLDWSSGLYVAR